MGRSSPAPLSLLLLLLVVALQSQGSQANILSNFEGGLDGWKSYRNGWRWANRNSLGSTLPKDNSGDGFAVMSKATSDELYSPDLQAPFGGNFTLKFYIRSQYSMSNDLKVMVNRRNYNEDFLSLQRYSHPYTNSWSTVQEELPPQKYPFRFAIFCYNGKESGPGEALLGCAIDEVTFQVYGNTTPHPPTAPPTAPPVTTARPTIPDVTTARPTTPNVTTARPTIPNTTAHPTIPDTTAHPTIPDTTARPTIPDTTARPTIPDTTARPTIPDTTARPTVPDTTARPTIPDTTARPTIPDTTTRPTIPDTTARPTIPDTTARPTIPDTTTRHTDPPVTTTDHPTDPPVTATDHPTDPPVTATDHPTDPPVTATDHPTDPPVTTAHPTDGVFTTGSPSGPLVFDFEESVGGWSLVHMNNAAFKRVPHYHPALGAPPPPSGSMVLQVFADNVQAGTVVATGPQLEATADTMRVTVTFWMNGTLNYPSQLRLRRQFKYNDFEDSPIMNLDPFGDQMNTRWLRYTMNAPAIPGERFSLIFEASLGADLSNVVAVSEIELSGVKAIENNVTTIFNFEDGLEGWMPGKMDGGILELKTWSAIDPSLNMPQPLSGEKFLFASRSSIHSGILSLESPILEASKGAIKRLSFNYFVRGSVTYPAVLRMRKKTPDGRYDDLPFVDLRRFGNSDNQEWFQIDKDVQIPLEADDTFYQLVIEVDLGSWMGNLVAVDALTISTYYK